MVVDLCGQLSLLQVFIIFILMHLAPKSPKTVRVTYAYALQPVLFDLPVPAREVPVLEARRW